MGHNMGMEHDFSLSHDGDGTPYSGGYPKGKCATDKNIMSYDSSRVKWSPCSKMDFQALYLSEKDHWCLDGKLKCKNPFSADICPRHLSH